MFPPTNKSYWALLLTLFLVQVISCASLSAATPEDETVSEYLQESSLLSILEVQLFDRIERERDPEVRVELSNQLGRMYLDRLGDEQISEDTRRSYLLKGQVLVGLIPENELLELRLELLVEQYKEYEQIADLKRIDLLDPMKSAKADAALETLHSMFTRIAIVADADVERFNRQAARTSGDSQRENEQQLADSRAVFSRARFFEGWAGYSLAVVRDVEVNSEVLKSFGWVLGFDGKLPVLEEVDVDLLEYDHVARAMIGVALCKLQNNELSSSRLWLDAVQDSAVAPEFAVNFAKKRQIDISLAEMDWKRALGETRSLLKDSDTEIGVSLSRLVVIRTMDAQSADSDGRGGEETATELAKLGLNQLVELGEIGHVIDLLERYGTLPDIGRGFVAYYAQGSSELMQAETSATSSGFMEAAVRFGRALAADDVEQYLVYAADAGLKMAYCELRSDRAAAALRTLEEYSVYFSTPEQLEESAWLEILALDAVVRSGQEQMGPRLAEALGVYIRQNSSSERASKLIVQFALSPYLDDTDAIDGLVIDDPSDPLALPARRKLIQMLYKNPQIANGGESQSSKEIIKHSLWIWNHESDAYTNIREARERLAVCRIAVIMGLEDRDTSMDFLKSAVVRLRSLIESEPSLNQYISELTFREIQVMLLQGNIDRAAEIVLSSTDMNDEHMRIALSMVFGNAHRRFMEQRSVPHAQALVRYGQALIGMKQDNDEESMSARMSLNAESVVMGAMFIAEETNDPLMREYAYALSLRVFEHGLPSEYGLITSAQLCEEFGHSDEALACWNRLVNTLNEQEFNWHRARYESLRLLVASDIIKAGQVYQQYRTLYPDGSPEPWGSKIQELFPAQHGDIP